MKNAIYILGFIFLICIASCVKENASTLKQLTPAAYISPIGHLDLPPLSTDGFGPSKKPLTGRPYQFPAGVILLDNILTTYVSCGNNLYYECATDGTLPFFMSLHNSNTVPTLVIFPAGLIIPCSDTTLQGAVLVQADSVTLPALSIVCVNLNALCINDTRTFSNVQAYGSPLLTNNYNLGPLMDLLATKRTIVDDPTEIIQKAVWHIADTGVMTDSDRIAISIFP